MIYEFIRSMKEEGHRLRHFFRALTCKHYYVERHGFSMCDARGKGCTCNWYWCPKRKGGEDE